MQSWSTLRAVRLIHGCAILFATLAASPLVADDGAPTPEAAPKRMAIGLPVPRIIFPLPDETATLYDSGEEVVTSWEEIWQPMCGPGRTTLTREQLENVALSHHDEIDLADPETLTIVDTSDGLAGGGINIVFTLGSSVPSAAASAFVLAETYLESLFSDPITVTISVSFQNMGSGVLGSTGSNYTTVSYNTSRNGLINNKDANDVIQTHLPTGFSCPVRFNGASSTVSSESTIYWTRAAYKSTVGSVFGNAASMTFNTAFAWDYNPANGIGGTSYSFVDVLIHEVGHALGFTSATDWNSTDMTTLDLFRFQSTDGSGDYNPDTNAEFQVRPRLVDYNTPNDSHISDVISSEWKMSDGDPWQASHFKEQTPIIGLMDPAIGWGQTRYPNYFTTADISMFDAIGYDN